MKKYHCNMVVSIGAGMIGLSDEQASARSYALSPTDVDGIYQIDKPIAFKRGEIIGLDEIGKGQLLALEPVGDGFEEPGKAKGSGKSNAPKVDKKAGGDDKNTPNPDENGPNPDNDGVDAGGIDGNTDGSDINSGGAVGNSDSAGGSTDPVGVTGVLRLPD